LTLDNKKNANRILSVFRGLRYLCSQINKAHVSVSVWTLLWLLLKLRSFERQNENLTLYQYVCGATSAPGFVHKQYNILVSICKDTKKKW